MTVRRLLEPAPQQFSQTSLIYDDGICYIHDPQLVAVSSQQSAPVFVGTSTVSPSTGSKRERLEGRFFPPTIVARELQCQLSTVEAPQFSFSGPEKAQRSGGEDRSTPTMRRWRARRHRRRSVLSRKDRLHRRDKQRSDARTRYRRWIAALREAPGLRSTPGPATNGRPRTPPQQRLGLPNARSHKIFPAKRKAQHLTTQQPHTTTSTHTTLPTRRLLTSLYTTPQQSIFRGQARGKHNNTIHTPFTAPQQHSLKPAPQPQGGIRRQLPACTRAAWFSQALPPILYTATAATTAEGSTNNLTTDQTNPNATTTKVN